jgi:N-acetylglucosaminyl-diphospho-decaprenol L-rhamnosyltransferase
VFSVEKSPGPSDNLVDGASELLAHMTAVVLNWDEPKLTIRCVEALIADGVPAGRIVVVDNGSTGDSYEQFERTLGDCVLVRLPTNVGIARAVNAGAARLPGDDYLILNNDAFVHGPESVERLVRALRRTGIGLAVPRTLNADLTLQPSVVALVGPATALVGAFGLSRLIPNRWQPRWSTHWDHGESRTVDAASGAVFAIRGEVWRELGGMTERTWMYGEDIDLCRRARRAGWSIWFDRDTTFVHLGSSTVSRHWSDATRSGMIARSEIATLRSQLPPIRAWSTMFLLAFGVSIRWLAFSAMGKRERATVFRAVLGGYLSAMLGRESRSREDRRAE